MWRFICFQNQGSVHPGKGMSVSVTCTQAAHNVNAFFLLLPSFYFFILLFAFMPSTSINFEKQQKQLQSISKLEEQLNRQLEKYVLLHIFWRVNCSPILTDVLSLDLSKHIRPAYRQHNVCIHRGGKMYRKIQIQQNNIKQNNGN